MGTPPTAALVLWFGEAVAYLLSRERQLNVVTLIREHFLRDHDDIGSKPQRSLDLANQNGFTVVNACFGD
jgi:hypothetical protein